MATETVIRDKVLSELSKASGVPKAKLKDEWKLRDDLQISHPNYVALAQNLRSFVKGNNSEQTLLLNEIDTAAATVGSVFQLVSKRING